MRAHFIGSGLLLAWVASACGGGTQTCPPDFPVLRDGFCYPADAALPDGDGGSAMDGGGTLTDAGRIDGASSGDASSALDASAADGSSVICRGTHPLLDGSRRYCDPGDCFCADPDACFPSEVAAACCSVAVVCGGTDGGTAICRGTHPLLEGSRRYCESGDCFCATPDACFPSEVAAACCTVAVVCE